MSTLFPLRLSTEPFRARAKKPKVTIDRSPDGRICAAACMFATGPECDCWCLGRNHQRGMPILACDDPQKGLGL